LVAEKKGSGKWPRQRINFPVWTEGLDSAGLRKKEEMVAGKCEGEG